MFVQKRRDFRIGIHSVLQLSQSVPFVRANKKLDFLAKHFQSPRHLLSFRKRNARIVRSMDNKKRSFDIFDSIYR